MGIDVKSTGTTGNSTPVDPWAGTPANGVSQPKAKIPPPDFDAIAKAALPVLSQAVKSVQQVGSTVVDALPSKPDPWDSVRATTGGPANANPAAPNLNDLAQAVLPVLGQAVQTIRQLADYGHDLLPTSGGKAQAEFVEKSVNDFLKTVLGEEGFQQLTEMKAQLADAHSEYLKTGKMPENSRFAPIEIKEGELMTKERRYDSFMASQEHNPVNLRMEDVDFMNRDEFMTKGEFEEEYQRRLEAAKQDFVSSCPTRWTSTSDIETCQANVTEKYFGQAGAAQYRSDMADAKRAGQAYQEHVESVRNGGPFSMLGREIDLLAGGDGETGASFGGMLDLASQGYAEGKGKMSVDQYEASGGLEVRGGESAEIEPRRGENRDADSPGGGGVNGGGGGGGEGPGGVGGGGGGDEEYGGPSLRRLGPNEAPPAGVPALTRQQARMIGDLRAGRDVIVPDLETARALLRNMPDLRPLTTEGRYPYESAPRGTYRGDLVNAHDPAAPYVHEPGTSADEHARNMHYNIVFPNGQRAAILIVPR